MRSILFDFGNMMTHMMSLVFDDLFVWTYQVEVYLLAFGGSLVVVATAKNATVRQIKNIHQHAVLCLSTFSVFTYSHLNMRRVGRIRDSYANPRRSRGFA